MGFLFQKKTADLENAECGQLVNEAQHGNTMVRERLIKDYTPFILKVVSKVVGRYVRMGEDDEVSIALLAFNEAIDCFDFDKNQSFLGFAETVIKRRLIDYFRKETNSTKNLVPISSFEYDEEGSGDGNYYYLESKQSIEVFKEKNEVAERKEEILLFSKKLSEFGIGFSELVEISPKHEDARIRAMDAARIVAQNPIMRQHLVNKKELPLKTLELEVGISRKTLERQRKYIIAVALIVIFEFDYLKQYIAKVL